LGVAASSLTCSVRAPGDMQKISTLRRAVSHPLFRAAPGGGEDSRGLPRRASYRDRGRRPGPGRARGRPCAGPAPGADPRGGHPRGTSRRCKEQRGRSGSGCGSGTAARRRGTAGRRRHGEPERDRRRNAARPPALLPGAPPPDPPGCTPGAGHCQEAASTIRVRGDTHRRGRQGEPADFPTRGYDQ
jgi:hypothetical protein